MKRSAILCCSAMLLLSVPLLASTAPAPQSNTANAPAAADQSGCGKTGAEKSAPRPEPRRAAPRRSAAKPMARHASAPRKGAAAARPARRNPCSTASSVP